MSAPGYYKNPEKTNEVFIKNTYGDDTIYKTGDLGYFKPNGEIVCLGRKDNQIKIRGFRIELDDISSNILLYDGIKNAVVIDKTDKNNQKYLCAYIVTNKKIDKAALKAFLVDLLPNYMIPTYFVELEALPLTINHKIDRKQLPDPIDTDIIQENPDLLVKPTTKTEKQLSSIFCECLNIKEIGVTTDIFTYPVDSLNIIRIQTKMLECNLRLNTQDFYKERTLQKLAFLIDNAKQEKNLLLDEKYLSNVNSSFKKHGIDDLSIKSNNFNNILLLGATGYLGAHMLHSLLESTNSKIYCIVRGSSNKSAENRLSELYFKYFNTNIDLNRVVIIESDITKHHLGLDDNTYDLLLNTIDLSVNTAANVKYYGDYEVFKKINVNVVKYLSEFSKESNTKLIHVSTLGVSGNYLINSEKNTNIFTENDFFVGQQYDENVYIQTKFEAEKYLYENPDIDASIFRVGNLTSRFSDGKFQLNFEANAFYNILVMILKYHILPQSMLKQFLEFTPVDMCADAIVKTIFDTDFNKFVFHFFNNNYISAENLLDIFKTLGYDTEILTGSNFKKRILKLSIDNPNENILKGIVNDLDENLGLSFISTVKQENDFTNTVLNKLNFAFPNVSFEYITSIINYLKQNDHI